ncbi:hypothetical protein [Aquamicrobium zhengzhouense]|uniref:Uncharacterized protein n=1 Tax=Aquamicrobium zhengzhouense TaxID=2781738 RepID=A0ABS0SH49_9HYPH|nr:hypothetical protein [Aquamicrobium zhengzhouense]MBI1622638.1 hypothetical protein [Aquamicrobium zhengzhouense]
MPKADNTADVAVAVKRRQSGTTASSGPAQPLQSEGLAFDYDEFNVTVADREVLEEVRTFFVSVGRKRTDEIFECGQALAKVEARLPDQKAFDAWARKACRITRRGAANYIGVYRNLTPFRDRFVSQSVPGSAMYKLISAEPSVIDTVLSSYESGKPLTVNDIGRMVFGGGDITVKNDGDLGGREGLRRLIAYKTAVGVPEVMDTAVDILSVIIEALERHRGGKKIVKDALSKEIVGPSRVLRQQIEWLTWIGTVSGPIEKGAASLKPRSEGGRWAALRFTLYKMGGIEGWPKASELADWLSQEVLPLLEWLLGSEAERARSKAEISAKRRGAKPKGENLTPKVLGVTTQANLEPTTQAAW